MTSYRQSMKDTLELMNLMREAKLLERDLTPDEEKRREEIAKDLPDDDFKKRYGDQWMQVKMATATNMVKKEEVDLEEGKMKDLVIKGQDLEMYAKKSGGVDKNDMMKVAAMLKKGNKSGAVKYAMELDTDPKEYILNLIGEETELDEVGGSAFGGTIDKIQKVVDDKQATKIDGVMVDTFTASLIMNIFNKVNKQNQDKMRKMKVTQLANAAYKLAGVKEEVELDEAKMKPYVSSDSRAKEYNVMNASGKVAKTFNDMDSANRYLEKNYNKLMKEQVEIEEGRMQDVWQKKNAKSLSVGPFELLRGKSGVHTIKRSGKVIGDFSYDSDADNFVANMKGMKGQWTGNDIDSLFTHLQKVHKEEIEEASASADARRAMRRDPDMLQRTFSKDDSATDDDKKAASKNIMMQMRKAQSLKGRFDVEFQDGKKVKIPAKMAIAVQQKYNSMRKPSDKEKFQAKVAKSYRDMLNALKESAENPDYKAGGKSKAAEYRNKAKQMVGAEAVSPAQQAAIAISKKERGEKPKKESILDRIDRKIKENKNG